MIALVSLLIIIPVLVVWFYEIGEKYPVIITPYTESDMINYFAAAIGIIISVLAVIIGIGTNQVRLRMWHATTINDKGEVCVLIRVINDGVFDCDIAAVCISNKEHNHSAHLVSSPPFAVKAKSSVDLLVPTSRIIYLLDLFKRRNEKVCYSLELSTGSRIYLDIKGLEDTVNNQINSGVELSENNAEKGPIKVKVNIRKRHRQ